MFDHRAYDLVYVEWADHQGSDDWCLPEDIQHSPTICHAVGWRFQEDDAGITLFGSISEGGQIGNRLFVMRAGVRRVVVQKKARKRKEPKAVNLSETPHD